MNRAPLGLSTRDHDRMEHVQRLAQSGAAGAPGLVALLSEPSWVVRRTVVAALVRIGAPAIRPLCDVLRAGRSNEASVAAAVDALVALGPEVDNAVLALEAEATDPAIICDMAQIMGRRGNRSALPTLARLSAHEDDNVAVAAIEALGRIGGAAVVEPLLLALGSGNFFRVFPAIAVLGASRDPRSEEPLIALLPLPHYTAEAAAALGRSGRPAAVAPLARVLVAADDGVVRAAALALTEIHVRSVERSGDPDAVPAVVRAEVGGEAASHALERALRGADPAEAVSLATLLVWLENDAGVPALLALLEGEPGIAASAFKALRGLGQDAEPVVLSAIREGESASRARLLPLLGARRSVVPELVVCLKDPDPAVRAQACSLLARIGDPSAVGPLFTLVGDPDASVAQSAIAGVQSLGSEDSRTHAIAAARSSDPRTRRAALKILSYFGYPEGLDILLEAITDGDERIREGATSGLALLEDPRALAALITASEHPVAGTRAATMRALGNAVDSPDVIAVLRRGLRDLDAWVRYYACQSLGRLQVASEMATIEGMLADPAGQVRVAAVDVIARLGGERALTALAHAVRSADPDVRRAALMGLGRIRRPEALAILSRASDSDDPSARLAAVLAIGEATTPDTTRALIRAGSDLDPRVRATAFELIASRPGPQATQWLIEQLAVEADRERALSALTNLVDGRIEGILLALETADRAASGWLLEALLRTGRPNGNAAAEAALHLDNVNARRAAAAALANLGTSTAQRALAAAEVLDPDDEVRRICAAGR